MRAALGKYAVVLMAVTLCGVGSMTYAQKGNSDRRRHAQSVTIPVTVRLPEQRKVESEVQIIEALTVLEDGKPQEILSTRGATRVPLALAVLIQDDIVPSLANEIKGIAEFIRRLPPGSRVFVGYIRAGSLEVRQRFTTDLEKAAKALRIPFSSSTAAPYNPYVLTRDALKRFESLPIGRRAVLLVSDGLDTSRGFESSTPTQSTDLQRAITEAQRRGVAIYSIYAPTVGATSGGASLFSANAQGSLQKLSSDTGGLAFFQGTSAPTSFDRFLREINTLLARQFALSYLSTNTEKGFRRIEVLTNLSDGKILHPSGYVRQ